ncbi:cell cycle checkpoint control protein family isoform X2 [Wolffia australiana]
MELSVGLNSLRTFTRCVTCLARIGNELVIQASTSQLIFHTINSSRTAYQSASFKPDFFDSYVVSACNGEVQCSVLLKAVCAVFRTSVNVVDRLAVILPASDAPKIQWTLECFSGVKKTYWINCNVEPDVHQLSLERERYPSNFVVRPRDLARLLANFQSKLHEITIIARDSSTATTNSRDAMGGKAVELRSYIDPLKDSIDSALHTQLWIDPAEEFLQYTHSGEPVDVTFCVKELKAFLTFCEGCEVDILLCFEKAGEPVLMAPKFGFNDASNSNFDATLVLCTMLASQLPEEGIAEGPPASRVDSGARGSQTGERNSTDRFNNRSERTYRPFVSPCQVEADPRLDELHDEETTDHTSKHHASNWLEEDEDDDDNEDAFVPSTPPF